jgi:thiol-disulfide isomerase/thioredoxin
VSKKLNLLLTIIALLILPLGNFSYAQESNNVASDFDLPGKQSNVKLSDSKGKLVYLDFWASWCGPCKQSFPWMNALQEKYRSKGLEVIAVNLDSNNEDAQKFLATTPAKFTVAFDSKGRTPLQYGVKGMPTSYLISPDGKIIMQHMGFNAADRDMLEQKIQSLLEDRK